MASNQIFSIPLQDNKYLIYAPLKRVAFIGNGSLVNQIFEYKQSYISNPLRSASDLSHKEEYNSCATDFMSLLDQIEFFADEVEPTDDIYLTAPVYDTIILFLTNQCNLRCTYCYASSGDFPEKRMPWITAKSGIDFVFEQIKRNKAQQLTIGFHGGGEPTLNRHVLTRAVEYSRAVAKKSDIELSATGSFNGYWDNEITKYIINNFTEISLSFDGLPQTQNRQRPTARNSNSSDKVMETLSALDAANFDYGVRMTVTSESASKLHENISFICKNFKPSKIQVEPVFMEGRAIQNKSAISDLDLFIEQITKGIETAGKYNIEVFYSGARLEAITNRFCLAALRALVVTPDGDITTCFEVYGKNHPHAQYFIVGKCSKNGRIDIDPDKLNKRLAVNSNQKRYCEACFCKWHCAGDCSIKTTPLGSDSKFVPSDRCYVNRQLTKLLIIKSIKDNGGLIWTGNRGPAFQNY
ncbi:putative radical SAM domain protein [Desulfosarcina cetonica]|uniref:radical SAM/SPASM domain-containing protein n=1 Tax=Desulfosarcina cetonica TaxID=90730 RepID=UPI0006D22D57|nr:radical SAM protein [Desulfosarcina cetonica]VTR67840.1 putative radical SAM domain protein [Desulfosarcina cetonica]